MAKGFLSGAALGLVASVAAAGALSVVVGFPEGHRPMAGAPDTGTTPSPGVGRETSDDRAEAPGEAPAEGVAADTAGTDAPAETTTETSQTAAPPPEPEVAVAPETETQTDADADTNGAETTAEASVDPAESEDTPEDAETTEPAVDAENATASDTNPEPREPARRPGDEAPVAVSEEAARLDAPASEERAAPAVDAASPAARPEAAQDSDALAAPDAPDEAGEVAVADDAPVAPPPPSDGPAAPAREALPDIATEPAQPPAPDVPSEESGLVAEIPDDGATPDERIAALPQTDGADTPEADQSDSDTATEDAPATDDAAEDTADAATEDETDGGPAIGERAGSFTQRENAVPVRRPGAEPEAAASDTGTAEDADAPPIQRYAAPAVEAGDRPLLSVVLIDDGAGPLGPDALDAFPFPVTFAVDPGLPDVEERMSGYRARGFEVMALAGMPEAGTPADAEVAIEAALSALPEAVGVLERPGSTLQGSRAVSDQVAEILSSSGHGLLMAPDGLNTGQQLAARAGVPSATIFRDFDGEGQDPTVQRRFLDQAAFRAGQEGAVVMLGRLRADTISALLLWSLQDRADEVALVPASQVLRRGASG
ncbi:Divergent polysaccharide deacetylase [Roseivivax jejudonensis]|uniref:Divergent polysaccharide deacetylase n=1 Tax=Roseivivax jejudonensis TaxID=1529041 RepID=A0A1X6YQ37_9RHOB|nr:divergent polysaccharide deacteylase family protein [Roseivivax jejudonensis]SLN27338.1 Divergent polysaccharide deacetylase [Roseivivax jejudonensis]